MKSEEIKIIQQNVETVKALDEQIKELDHFIKVTNLRKDIRISNGSKSLYFSGVDLFEFVGEEILKLLDGKLTQLEKQLHNYSIVDLLKTEDSNELNFDIYERVAVPFSGPICVSLGTYNTRPEMVTFNKEEGRKLHGNIVLEINYSSDETANSYNEHFTHRIPVDVDLPPIYDVDNIDLTGVKIEVATNRVLNVSGTMVVKFK